jgi:hypothetical protein
VDEPGTRHLLDQLGSAAMRRTLECVGGYDLASTGRRVA